ncbi:LuxR family transcriptional regulator [Cellulomonas sp. Root930]|nr:LuxR family transcriptional regulator [Cellulomonas sp. Root930]
MLHGRDVERATLLALVHEACAGRAGALVLHGDPGIGKTALLDDVAAAASGVLVLRTGGLESESPLAFAALHRLLRPVLSLIERIPAPQADALGAALGRCDVGRVDPFLVAVATLSVLTEAAELQPVLVVVDDAHWLDAASADALLFTARRLQADRVVMLFSVRDGAATSFRHEGVPSLVVGRLDRESVGALIAEKAGLPAAHDVLDLLVVQSDGNPLALGELAATLTSAQLTGDAPVPDRLLLTADMERAFLERARRLPDPAQGVLLIVAADDSGRIATVRRAAVILGLGEEALEQAESSGLVDTDGDTLRVRHPLVRSAIYQAATGSERRSVHRALAAALEGHGEPDRQAWHAGAAAEGPDATLAASLHAAGAGAEQRGGYVAAADFWERSAELTPDTDLRASRRFAAARNAWAAGQVSRTRLLASAARGETADPALLADIDRLRGRIEVSMGSGSAAHRIYATAALAAATRAPGRALDLAVAAAGLAAYGGDSGLTVDPDVIADRPLGGVSARDRTLHTLLRAMTSASQGRWADAVNEFRAALDEGVTSGDPDVLAHLGQAAVHLGDDIAAARCFAAMLDGAREHGAGMTVLYALPRLAFPQFLLGQWSTVLRLADEAHALSRSTGHTALAATPLAWLALLAALRGEAVDPDQLAELDDIVDRHPLGILAGPTSDLRRWADGARAAQSGAHHAAHHHLSQIQIPALARVAAIDRIDAAVRAGEIDHARAWVDELVPFAESTRWPWALGAVDHGRALVAKDADAAGLFERSIGHYAHARRPFDLARTHLAYGEHLRRAQQRVDARTHLRRALEMFEDLHAGPLATRAANELRASGETARKRDVSTLVTLTPMERQVAQLVSQGLSNKEVAAQCWVSPRTVAFHLRNCFAKTGVTSRGALAQLTLS